MPTTAPTTADGRERVVIAEQLKAFLRGAYPDGNALTPHGGAIFTGVRAGTLTNSGPLVVAPGTVPGPADFAAVLANAGTWIDPTLHILTYTNPEAHRAVLAMSGSLTQKAAAFRAAPTARAWHEFVAQWVDVVRTIYVGLGLGLGPRGVALPSGTNPYIIYGAVGLILLLGGAWIVTRKG